MFETHIDSRAAIRWTLGIVIGLVALLTLCPQTVEAQGISCGPGDGPGKVLKATVTDSQGNKYKLYCVDGSYFKGEWCLADETPTFCFGKCTFPGGENCYIFDRDENGRFKRVVLINVAAGCPNFHDTWKQKDGETKAEQEARIRQHVEDNGCDSNIYSIDFSPYIQVIDVYEAGLLVDSISLFPDETMHAYDSETTPFEFLIEDPDMQSATQTADIAETVWDDFEDGVVGDRYSALTNGPRITEGNGSMTVTINQPGDGVAMNVLDLNPACAQFEDLVISPFAPGDGLGFEVVFENGDAIGLEIYQISSVRIKVTQTQGMVKRELSRTLDEFDVDDISDVQIDWVPGNQVKFEITLANGDKKEIVEPISALDHASNRTSEYRIFGLDIQVDPTVSIGSATFSDEHEEAALSEETPEEPPEAEPTDPLTPRRLTGSSSRPGG